MCGFAGFHGEGDLLDLRKMQEALVHRGPDGSGSKHDQDNHVFLGHQRLMILDEHGGPQPMVSQDRQISLVYNGEIYNHLELRSYLKKKGHSFSSDHSDTETLLNAYREWGEKVCENLNGMFSFIIYDKKNKLLFGARDHYGQKPLYFTKQNGLFAFASELRSLCQHSKIHPEIDSLSLKKYFAYDYVPAPQTIFSNIYKLPAGHSLTYSLQTNDFRVDEYYRQKYSGTFKGSQEQACETLVELLQNAVKRCLQSDVPLGVFLSGGIDSSSIAALAQRSLSKPVHTFSINFEEKSFDESKYSNEVAKFIGSHHHQMTLSINKAKEIVPLVLQDLDEPLGDGSLLPTFLVSQFARKHVKVTLGGDGADELFAGYDPFKALQYASLYHKMTPYFLHPIFRRGAYHLPVRHNNLSFDFKVKRFMRGLSYPPELWAPWWMSSLEIGQFSQLFQEEVTSEELFAEAIHEYHQCQSSHLIDKNMNYYTQLYLPNDILTKVDRASMMNSLETRAPYLDTEFTQFVQSLPAQLKFQKGKTKFILKKSLEKILPKEILYRKKKGFGIPIGQWLKDDLDFQFKNESSLLSKSFIQSQIDHHRSGKENNKSFLWNLYVLEQSFAGQYL